MKPREEKIRFLDRLVINLPLPLNVKNNNDLKSDRRKGGERSSAKKYILARPWDQSLNGLLFRADQLAITYSIRE